jgi:eukaryotic-like serine/threonine-protein kinase
VVPSQRPQAAATQAIPAAPPQQQQPQPKPTGQIGGRAMLAPGESLSGHLAKIKQEGGKGGRRRARETPEPLAETMAGNPTTVLPPSGAGGGPTTVIPPSGGGDTTSVIPPRAAWNGARAASEPLPGTVVGGRKASLDKALRSARTLGANAVTTFRGWSRNQQLAIGGGALVIVVLLAIITFSGGGDDTPAPQATGGDQTVPASFDTQDYKGKGFTVKVPKGWTRSSAGSWVDYTDPKDGGRKVRILVEKGTATPRRWAEIAENTLKNSNACTDPYHRIAVTDVQVGGHAGAQLEYTCGAGDTMRHGVWRETTVDGRMYSFYLTSNESKFAASKVIFDEMTKTYAFGSA